MQSRSLKKSIALSVVALVFALLFVIPLLGLKIYWGQLLLLVLLGSIFASLVGMMLASFSDNFSQFIYPAMGIISVLTIPAALPTRLTESLILRWAPCFSSFRRSFTFFLSRSTEYFLYWIPTYWTYAGLRAVLIDNAGWVQLAKLVTAGTAVITFWFAVTYPFLRRRQCAISII